ncbi:MAG: 2'-5' RNA ligase family protein [Candidatus Woesearchaeota archaeon]
MTLYLIEFRFHGYAKRYAKNIIYDVAKKFKVKGVTRKRAVPHMTLFGPFSTNNEINVIKTILNVCRKYQIISFRIKGFNYFDSWANKVIFLDIVPSKELKELRWELAKKLRTIVYTLSEFDKKKEFFFHATIAFKDIDTKFDKIWKYIKNKEEPNINQKLLRITIVKNGKILCEYDFIQKKLLNRKEALSKKEWLKTINKYKQLNFDAKNYLTKEITLFDKIKSFFEIILKR